MNPNVSPYFSIIIPCLNEANYLPKLLDDLAAQSYQDFEVIIVDAKSKDNTLQQAKKFKPTLPSLKLLTSPQKNVSTQRNQGAQQAKADWLLFMDADNRLPPYFLQGIKYRLESTSTDLFSTHIRPDSHNKKDRAVIHAANFYMELQKHTAKPQAFESMLGIKKQIFNQLHGFDPSIHWAEGTKIYAAAIKQGFSFTIFKDPTYIYSFRRLRSQGTLKTARITAQFELARLMNIPISTETTKKLYPLSGGQLFKSSQNQISPIFTALKQLSQITALPKEPISLHQLKPSVLRRIKSLLSFIDQEQS
jgi:glycosyltransferase involved in cell wall biosynthesis